MTTHTIFADGDGYIGSNDTTYATARTGGTIEVFGGTGSQRIGQLLTGGAYNCYELYFDFDLSSLDGLAIGKAFLSLEVSADASGQDFILEWRAFSFTPSPDADTGDWISGASLGSQPLYGTFDTADLAGGRNDFPLDTEDAIADLNAAAGGVFQLFGTSDRFRLGTAPAFTPQEVVTFDETEDTGTSEDPYLDIIAGTAPIFLVDSDSNSSPKSEYTFTVDYGVPVSDNDFIVIEVGTRNGAPTGVTVSGNAATSRVAASGTGSGTDPNAAIYTIADPVDPEDVAGTRSGDVVVTASSTSCGIVVKRLVNPDSEVPSATASDNAPSGDVCDVSLNTVAGGALAAVAQVESSSTSDWTGATEDSEQHIDGSDYMSSAGVVETSAETPRTVTVDGSGASDMVAVAASWAPAADGGVSATANAVLGTITASMAAAETVTGAAVAVIDTPVAEIAALEQPSAVATGILQPVAADIAASALTGNTATATAVLETMVADLAAAEIFTAVASGIVGPVSGAFDALMQPSGVVNGILAGVEGTLSAEQILAATVTGIVDAVVATMAATSFEGFVGTATAELQTPIGTISALIQPSAVGSGVIGPVTAVMTAEQVLASVASAVLQAVDANINGLVTDEAVVAGILSTIDASVSAAEIFEAVATGQVATPVGALDATAISSAAATLAGVLQPVAGSLVGLMHPSAVMTIIVGPAVGNFGVAVTIVGGLSSAEVITNAFRRIDIIANARRRVGVIANLN